MEENKNEVLQEVNTEKPTEQTVEQPVQEKEQPVEETKEVKKEEKKENVTKVSVPSFGNTKPTVTKIDLTKPINQENNEETEKPEENNADDSGVVAEPENAEPTQKQEEVQPEAETQEQVEEKIEEVAKAADEAIQESMETGNPLPENIQKLVDFMEETGGTIDEYVTLNKDYKDVDDTVVLREYYKATKSHLSDEEINFLLEDQFSIDEEYGDEKEIQRKKLAFKEQVAKARKHLDGLKSKYYAEIKSGTNLTKEQKEAVDFYNKFNEESKVNKDLADKQHTIFVEKTNNVFNNSFEGFEYNVGDKTYRYSIKDVEGTKKLQSDIGNFIGKFLDKNNNMEDAAGYHKSLFTAMNADSIAKHFYNQGKADALKQSIKDSKNIDMSPRQTHEDARNNSGITFKPINRNEGPSFKIKK